MNTDEVMHLFKGMIPIDITNEIIQIWHSFAKLTFILNEVVKKYPINQDEQFSKDCDEFAFKFIKEKFPHHVGEKE